MDNQTNIITAIPRRESWWSNVPKFWAVLVSVGAALVFVIGTYFAFTAMRTDVSDLKKEMLETVNKHDFKDLDEKVSRQWTTQTDNINRVKAEFAPVRDWVEWRKGYDQAVKDIKDAKK